MTGPLAQPPPGTRPVAGSVPAAGTEPVVGTGTGTGTAPIFIVGCQRSGTTLLRLTLDSHPRIACGPETRFLRDFERITGADWHRISRFGLPREYWLRSVGQFFGSFQADYAAARGKARWADKSPLYALILDYVWEVFPDAQVVHLIRDVKDVTSSHRTAFGYKAALNAPRKWQRYIGEVRRAAADVPTGRYHEVRYERLIADREGTMRELLGFLGEAWDPLVLDYERAEHDVNPRYWQRTTARRQGSRKHHRLDPLLWAATLIWGRSLRRRLGYGTVGPSAVTS